VETFETIRSTILIFKYSTGLSPALRMVNIACLKCLPEAQNAIRFGVAESTYLVNGQVLHVHLAGPAAGADVGRSRLTHPPTPRQHLDLVAVVVSTASPLMSSILMNKSAAITNLLYLRTVENQRTLTNRVLSQKWLLGTISSTSRAARRAKPGLLHAVDLPHSRSAD
jgi:hypothetical protein